MSEKLHPDVVRCYALESLLLHPAESRNQIENAWVFLLGTYFSDNNEPAELLKPEGEERSRSIFERFRKLSDEWKRFVSDAPYYKTRAPTAFSELERHLIKQSFEINIDINKEKDRIKEEYAVFHAISKVAISADRLRMAKESLAQHVQKTRFELDKERMYEAMKLFGDCADYALVRYFRERETRFLRLEADINRYLENITQLPTHLSIERLQPVLSSLLAALREDFLRAGRSRPTLEIRNVLDSDFYTVNEGQVALRLLLSSRDESAPSIEAIDIIESNGTSEPCHSPEPLHGGQSREIEFVVNPSEEQIIDGAFTVNAVVRYRNRNGDIEESEARALAVRLSDAAFEDIPNPYSRYASGTPVEDETMFFGRRSLVDKVVLHLSNGNLGQCFVLYGQKRSGKSSVLKQVEKRLAGKVLFASLSAGTFDQTNLWGSFARLLVQELEFRLEDIGINIPEHWPNLSNVESRPVESIRIVSRELHKLGNRLVIAVDEFTYIYENSKSGIEAFMRGWKALLEAKTFNAILVGQDTMPRFKQAYPNEFGVTHDERISYLSAEEAEKLATQPILLDGETRV